MSDLKSFVLLQARLYEFLAQQDESTLQALVSGEARLAVLGADKVPRQATVDRPITPADDPLQVAQDLSKLSSNEERRHYLNAAGLTVKDMRRVAKTLGLSGYGSLVRAKIIDLLAGHGLGRTAALADQPRTPATPPHSLVDNDLKTESRAPEVRPSTEAGKPDVDVVAIASHLRETETEQDGAAYLHEQQLDRERLLAVAAELKLTRVNRLSQSELEKRVLKQAIGARRKFAGLREW